MNHQRFIRSRFVLRVILLFTLVMLLVPFTPASVQAQGNVCVNDQGQAFRPGGPGWALLLNFNHAPSTTQTYGCVASIDPKQPSKVNYRTILCNVVNNVNNVAVGNGSAPFDGNFWVECAAIGKGVILQTSFTVSGRASFTVPGTGFTLVNHQDVGVTADNTGSGAIVNGLRPALNSRYGPTNKFSNTDPNTFSAGTQIKLDSGIGGQTGRHAVNGIVLQPTAAVVPFDFDYGKPIIVGAKGQPWTLFEIIIDPPGRCCSAS